MDILNDRIIREIEQIIRAGKTAEIVKQRHEIIVFERSSKKRISASVSDGGNSQSGL